MSQVADLRPPIEARPHLGGDRSARAENRVALDRTGPMRPRHFGVVEQVERGKDAFRNDLFVEERGEFGAILIGGSAACLIREAAMRLEREGEAERSLLTVEQAVAQVDGDL